MTAQNLKDMQQRRAARVALGGSIIYTVAALVLISRLAIPPLIPWLSWMANLLGGLGLEAYSRRFIPDWQHYPLKSNLKPILGCLSLLGLLFSLLLLAPRPH